MYKNNWVYNRRAEGHKAERRFAAVPIASCSCSVKEDKISKQNKKSKKPWGELSFLSQEWIYPPNSSTGPRLSVYFVEKLEVKNPWSCKHGKTSWKVNTAVIKTGPLSISRGRKRSVIWRKASSDSIYFCFWKQNEGFSLSSSANCITLVTSKNQGAATGVLH